MNFITYTLAAIGAFFSLIIAILVVGMSVEYFHEFKYRQAKKRRKGNEAAPTKNHAVSWRLFWDCKACTGKNMFWDSRCEGCYALRGEHTNCVHCQRVCAKAS